MQKLANRVISPLFSSLGLLISDKMEVLPVVVVVLIVYALLVDGAKGAALHELLLRDCLWQVLRGLVGLWLHDM
jgi:hypothetical protein